MKKTLLLVCLTVSSTFLASCASNPCCGGNSYINSNGCCGANSYTGNWY